MQRPFAIWSGEQDQLGDMAGLAPERAAQDLRVTEVRDRMFQRDLVVVMSPGGQLAVGSLGQRQQRVARPFARERLPS